MAENFIMTLIVNSAVFSVLYLIVLGMRRVLDKKLSALMIFALWAVAAVKLVIPFGFESDISPLSWLHTVPAATTAVTQETEQRDGTDTQRALKPAQDTVSEPLPYSEQSMTDLPFPEPAVLVNTQPAPKPLHWTVWALIVWGTGFGACMGWFLLCRFHVMHRIIRKGVSAPTQVLRLFNECREMLHIRRPVKVCVQNVITMPAVTGLWRPVLLLPESAINLNEENLRHIFMHELMHLKYGDLVWIRIMNLLNGIYWFHPLVWLCLAKVRADMETLCDRRVLTCMEDKSQSGYLQTVLYFAGEMHPGRLHAALSLSDGRVKMERRIHGMFRPRRTKKAVSAMALCTAAVLLTASLLTACQPTPGAPIVANKNDSAVQQVIAAAPEPKIAYESPETVTDSFKAKDENVSINIDAKVNVPEVQAFPVVTAAPVDISVDFIKTAAQVLMEGKTLYKPRTGLTKQEIEAEIIELQNALADPKHSKSDGLNADDPETVADTRKLFEDRIKIYQEQYEKAPDQLVREEAPIEFSPAKIYEDPVFYEENVNEWKSLEDDDQAQQLLDEYENEKKFVADADLDGGYCGQITISHYSGFGTRWSRMNFIKSKELNGLFMPSLDIEQTETTMTQEEAVEFAQQMMSRLGLNDMVMSTVWAQTVNGPDTGVCGYAIQYKRTYNGIPVSGSQFVDKANEALYGAVYDSEMISMFIKDGMIMSFDWQNPIEVTGTENENVALLPFEDIMDKARAQMAIEYNIVKLSHYSEENPDYDEFIANLKSGEVNISGIELGYMRMSVQDQSGSYRLVPVWRFYGNESVVMEQESEDAKAIMKGDRGDTLYLTLNAIDGSPIDEMMGY